MRILLWHGWLLEGSGSNVYTAKVAEVLRAAGHDVLLLCQEPNPGRFPFVDAWGGVGPQGPGPLAPNPGAVPAAGRLVVLRPDIGDLLPVFVVDEYEGFRVERFVDLSRKDLDAYLERNVAALRAAAAAHRPESVVAGHAVPGAAVARRALGDGRFTAKVHGSDLEYAVRVQGRYAELAREGLEGAVAVTGATRDVLERMVAVVPSIADRMLEVPPGVDVAVFGPGRRREALLRAAARLDADPSIAAGRPGSLDREVWAALEARDGDALDALALRYDQEAPDPAAPSRLRALAGERGPLVGYLGKLIPQKGVDRLLLALPRCAAAPKALVVGFGRFREWLAAMAMAAAAPDPAALAWLRERWPLPPDPDPGAEGRAVLPPGAVTFTGRLDHRYAPDVLAALDVLVVPSVLDEAFGMVAAEGAAAGALPLAARHSGLAEVAGALEDAAGRPGLFSFDPGPGAPDRVAAGIDRLLALPASERDALRAALTTYVAREWSWERTAERLLAAGSR